MLREENYCIQDYQDEPQTRVKKKFAIFLILIFSFGLSFFFYESFSYQNLPKLILEKATTISPTKATLCNSVQELRQLKLQNAYRLIENEENILQISHINERNFYSKRYEFSVCYVYKCGYSNWLKTLLIMEGFYKVEDYFSEETIKGAKVMTLGRSCHLHQ
ncbi:unnamed protein product [Clavelina lepadiformis]|uniref:Uncharacterized protein n=1 Tax=Clavelina lepadiformis TaxID=159417 RepID=A0ABP0G5I2_CLALP